VVTGKTLTGPDPGLHRSLLGITARITSKRMVTAEPCRFELHAADGGPLPAFTPGAHINVRTPRGEVRSYFPHRRPGGTRPLRDHRAPQQQGRAGR